MEPFLEGEICLSLRKISTESSPGSVRRRSQERKRQFKPQEGALWMNTECQSAMQMLFRKGRNPGDTDLPAASQSFYCLGKSDILKVQLSQFSFAVVSDSLLSHELQDTRPPCPLPTPEVYSDSCPLSRWCHPTISSSGVPFSSCPVSFPASGSFQMSQLFASVLPMNIQDWFPLGLTGWITLQS